MKKLLLLLLSVIYFAEKGNAQTNYGTTGLMNMPTADMQRDKTFMLGGNWLNSHATVPRWWYDTWNYYINITLFSLAGGRLSVYGAQGGSYRLW